MNKLVLNDTLDSTSKTIIICTIVFNLLYSIFELLRYHVDLIGIIIFLLMLLPIILLGGIMNMKNGLIVDRGKLKKATFLFGTTVDKTAIDDESYKTVGSIEIIRQEKGNSHQTRTMSDISYDVSIFKDLPSDHKRLFTSNSKYHTQIAIDFIIANSYLKAFES